MWYSEYFPFYKRNLILAMPVVLSQIGQVTVSLVDNMMVGHVGTVELAASAFANSIFMLGMYMGMGIAYGLTPMVGKAFGNKKKELVSLYLKNGIFSHIVIGLFLTAIMFFVYFFLSKMGQPPEVVILARPYYLWLCASYLPFMLFYSYKQFFEGLGNTKVAMVITISANLINIAANYAFIFGKFGFPELGLTGAGVGTFISRISMPLFFMIYILTAKRYLPYFKAARKQAIRLLEIIKILKVGVPIGVQMVVEVFAFAIGAIMMGWIGEVSLAAHQVALGLASLTYMISLGISSATTIRVSHQFGKHDILSVKRAAFASTHLVLFFMAVMGLVFISLKNYLPYLFVTDIDVIIIAANLLVVAALFQIFDGLQVVMLGALRGMSDVKIPMLIAGLAYLVVGIPSSYVFAFVLDLGPRGIWFGYLLGLGLAGILFYFRFRKILKIKA